MPRPGAAGATVQDRPAADTVAVVGDPPPRDRLRGHVARPDLLRRDLLLAIVLFAAEALLWALSPREFWPRSWVVALGWVALGYVAVALRRAWLWPAVLLVAAHTAVPFTIAPMSATAGVAIVVVTYTAAAYLPLRQAVAATVLIWVPGLVIATVTGQTTQPPLRLEPTYFLIGNAMVALVCFFVGRTVYTRRAYVAALEDRARAAEQNQQALTAQAVADERRRIARELHDVIAHHVSVMGVLATGSRRALTRDPPAADEALATIEETGRTALREMRRLLDVLRTDAEPAGELEPQPGLPAIECLVEQVREAGLPVRLSVTGEPGQLDPGVALTIYRIVQEALTNALKHAGAATAEVLLAFDPGEVRIEVCDTGRGPPPGGDRVGHGLVGMRERISLYRGSLRTGPRPGGGFRVVARIPVEGADGKADAS